MKSPEVDNQREGLLALCSRYGAFGNAQRQQAASCDTPMQDYLTYYWLRLQKPRPLSERTVAWRGADPEIIHITKDNNDTQPLHPSATRRKLEKRLKQKQAELSGLPTSTTAVLQVPRRCCASLLRPSLNQQLYHYGLTTETF